MSEIHYKPKIGISLGDFNGVGPEIIAQLFSDERIANHTTPILYGSSKIINYYQKKLEISDKHIHIAKSIDDINPHRANIINVWQETVEIKPGTMEDIAGTYAIRSLDAVIEDAMKAKIDAFVTAPLNKATVKLTGQAFSGHTGYIGNKTNAKPLMMLISDNLRVAPVTVHIPLKDVASVLTKELILEKIQTLHQSLIKDFVIPKPKIAVLGLNPHAGDQGIMGKEEQDIILPAISECKEKGMMVYGCYPADGFFGAGHYTQFDAILSMYHDQGLTPFKLMAFENGVNYSAGLPIIRTSPDHGTAYDIAGKGIANITSMLEAIHYAAVISGNRNMHYDLKKNPLKFNPMRRERFRLDI